ncbi:hypothetical protein N8S43_11680 [Enterobacter hormaechei subsp. steigerwaltii]|nr:hypothetical protein [Enterobacter hormaechei subsp. steigerwaltii]
MVKKSLRQFTLMATATVTLLLGSVPLYAQTADVQQKLAFMLLPYHVRREKQKGTSCCNHSTT